MLIVKASHAQGADFLLKNNQDTAKTRRWCKLKVEGTLPPLHTPPHTTHMHPKRKEVEMGESQSMYHFAVTSSMSVTVICWPRYSCSGVPAGEFSLMLAENEVLENVGALSLTSVTEMVAVATAVNFPF